MKFVSEARVFIIKTSKYIRKNLRIFLRLIVCLMLIFAGIAIGVYIFSDSTVSAKSKVTAFGLKDIGELYTQVGYYTTIVDSPEKADVFGVELPFTDSNYIFTCDGVIKAGYNFNEIYVRIDGKQIIISLPEPIIYNSLDHDSFVVFDEHNNIFTPLTTERMNDAFIKAENDGKEKAIQNGLIENAEENAKEIIEGFLSGIFDIEEEYEVKYE